MRSRYPSRRYEKERSKLEKRDRLLQTLLILMGLILASPLYAVANIPDLYYVVLFTFILSTVLLYSDWLVSQNPNFAFFVESVVASSFSFSLVFSFAYRDLFVSDILAAIGYLLVTFVVLVSIRIVPKKSQTNKIYKYLWYSYTALIIWGIYAIGMLSLL
ncbi:hypothetical protein V7O62_02130 [Methanolobus sp. ZRKC2]|uniref:hypothetical protein n=1 Tax=Methanolobus sp. ZRKC2 TaxID=3125783 RepID=UPI003252575D